MAKLKLGLIVGSNRTESINRKLALAIAKLGGDSFEATLIRIDDLPMYNQDNEQPVPAAVSRFKSEVEASDALLIVSPEHSRSIPAVLKNAIDWGSRPWGKNSWPNKPAAVTGTSPGVISTAVVQQHLRSILGDLGAHLIGGEAYVQYKPDMVDAEHNVSDAGVRDFLKAFIDRLAVFSGKLVAA